MNITKEQLLIAARRSLFKKSYYEFFKYFWSETSPEELVDNWHIKELCDELQKIGYNLKDRKPKEYDIVINIPPATSKSTICTVLFPVWLWTIDSSLKILTGSVEKGLALNHSVKSRTVINSPRFKELYPEIILKDDQNNKGSYDNTLKGNRTATSVGSAIIGQHFHLILIDDAITATATDIDIKTANEWMDVSLSTRKINKDLTPTILVMQRIHESDASANMLKRDNVKHICLPAELTKDCTPEYTKYYTDGLLDTVRLSRKILNQTKLELGSKGYSGQYLQNPVPSEGGILKKEWFRINNYKPEDLKNVKWDMFVDSAYTDKTKNDPTGIVIAGEFENNLIVKYAGQYWLEFPELLTKLRELRVKYGTNRLFIEPKATGKSIVQTLKKEGINAIELDSTQDSKLTRVNAVSPTIEAKRIILIQDSWNTLFIDECSSFPLASHDDMLDALCHAITKLLLRKTKLSYQSA
jgi:predicted phage terminase large subunit-like protein